MYTEISFCGKSQIVVAVSQEADWWVLFYIIGWSRAPCVKSSLTEDTFYKKSPSHFHSLWNLTFVRESVLALSSIWRILIDIEFEYQIESCENNSSNWLGYRDSLVMLQFDEFFKFLENWGCRRNGQKFAAPLCNTIVLVLVSRSLVWREEESMHEMQW